MPEPTPPFTPPAEQTQRDFPLAVVGIAAAVVALVVAALVLIASRHQTPNPGAAQPLDAYAANLPLTQLAMSEATSLSGGKSTFLDGRVTNKGSRTVTGITVQVFFRNDLQLPPHVETLPLTVIRTREPYVDTQPVAAAPLVPGEDREFRLIFESIPDNWNVRQPEIHVIRVNSR